MMNKKIIILIASITGSAFADGGTSATAVSAASAQPAAVVPVAAKTPAPTLVQAAPQPMLAASQAGISLPPASSVSVSLDDQLKQVQGLIQQNKLGVNGLLDMLNAIQVTDPKKVQHLGELKQRAQQMQDNLAKFETQLAESFSTRLTMLQKMQGSLGDFLAHITKFKASLAQVQQQAPTPKQPSASKPAPAEKPVQQPSQTPAPGAPQAAPALKPVQAAPLQQVAQAQAAPAPAPVTQPAAAPVVTAQPAPAAQQAPVATAPAAVSTEKAVPAPAPASQPAPVVAAPAAQPVPAVQPAPVKK